MTNAKGFKVVADKGKHFVLTQKGYDKTPDAVKAERAVGKPVAGFEFSVPRSWYDIGYVEEREVEQ